MEQLCLYKLEFKEEDPIYVRLVNLVNGENFKVHDIEVSKTPFGFYEISSEHEHRMFRNKEKTYSYMLKYLNNLTVIN